MLTVSVKLDVRPVKVAPFEATIARSDALRRRKPMEVFSWYKRAGTRDRGG